MKSLNMYLGSVIDNDDVHFESLLDDDDVFLGTKNDKKVIEEWIKHNYFFTGKLFISDDLDVHCSGEVRIKNKSIESLTNGLFRWGMVSKVFCCTNCENLKSLEGAPEKVGRSFNCSGCKSLISLEGAPEEVGGNFLCYQCKSLIDLNGAPKKAGGFNCGECENLKSLNYSYGEICGYFACDDCNNLKTLEGAPEKIKGSFSCFNCKNLTITDSDRKKYKIEN